MSSQDSQRRTAAIFWSLLIGGLALRLEADGLALTTVQERRGDWPWPRR